MEILALQSGADWRRSNMPGYIDRKKQES